MSSTIASNGLKVSPDIYLAAASHIQREYGLTGYRLGMCAAGFRCAVFEVAHADGSLFNIVADCWGNVKRPVEDSQQATRELAEQMSRDAVAV